MKNLLKYKLYFVLCLLFISHCSLSKAQGLENIIVEKYYISDADDAAGSSGNLPVGSVTYRIYVDMLPGYKFQVAYGNATHELRFATTTSFFNNEDRGATTANAIANIRLKNNSVMLDSWLSAGAASAGNFGILKTEDDEIGTILNADDILQNDDPLAGIPIKTRDGLMPGTPKDVTMVGIDTQVPVFGDGSANGNLFSSFGGAWSCLEGAVGPTAENKVLIAQITTDGEFSFELNIQIGTPEGGTEKYVARNAEANETQKDFLTYKSELPNIAPNITITSPANNSEFLAGDIVKITADASDTDGSVTKVEFYVNDINIGEDANAPYEYDWTSAAGSVNIKAVATDDKGAKTTSDIVTIIVGTVGINQLTINKEQLTIFPNPVKSLLSIEYRVSGSEYQNSIVNIYNSKGQLKYQNNLSTTNNQLTTSIDMSPFAKGQYILELSVSGVITTKKIIKN